MMINYLLHQCSPCAFSSHRRRSAGGGEPVAVGRTSQSASIIEQSSYIVVRAWISDVAGNFRVSLGFSKAAGCHGQTAVLLVSGGNTMAERTLDGADHGSVDMRLFIDIQGTVEFQVERWRTEGAIGWR